VFKRFKVSLHPRASTAFLSIYRISSSRG